MATNQQVPGDSRNESITGYKIKEINFRPSANGLNEVQFTWGRFRGNFVNGKADGFGIQELDGMREYYGDWKDGQCHGYGKLTVPKGFYEGGWKKGEGFGFGKAEIQSETGIEWREGGFKNGISHGWSCIRKISLTSPNNAQDNAMWYTVGFKEGRYYGYLRCHKGPKFTQEVAYEDGKYHGFCIGYDSGGRITWKSFYRNGTQSPEPTERFVIHFSPEFIAFNPLEAPYSDARTHYFDLNVTLTNNDNYKGSICYGKPHGYGVLVRNSAPKGIYEGGWHRGYAAGYGIWTGEDGNQYEGGWHQGKPHGYGKVTLNTGGEPFNVYWDGVDHKMFHDQPRPTLARTFSIPKPETHTNISGLSTYSMS
jgi:hypothetical protein